MTVIASFDTLFIMDSLRPAFPAVHISEVHSLGYLAYLLSLYDGNPATEWGYSFVYHDLGGPFSEHIADALETLRRTLHVRQMAGDTFELTEPGAIILSSLKSFAGHKARSKYLAACCDAAMSRPLPLTLLALQREPMVAQAAAVRKRHVLGVGPSYDALYEQVGALHSVLGANATDVWLAALLWLDYWSASAMKEKSQDET